MDHRKSINLPKFLVKPRTWITIYEMPRISRPMPFKRQSKLNTHILPVNSVSVLFEPFVRDETIDDDQIPNL